MNFPYPREREKFPHSRSAAASILVLNSSESQEIQPVTEVKKYKYLSFIGLYVVTWACFWAAVLDGTSIIILYIPTYNIREGSLYNKYIYSPHITMQRKKMASPVENRDWHVPPPNGFLRLCSCFIALCSSWYLFPSKLAFQPHIYDLLFFFFILLLAL